MGLICLGNFFKGKKKKNSKRGRKRKGTRRDASSQEQGTKTKKRTISRIVKDGITILSN